MPQALNVATYAVPSKVFGIMGVARPFIAIAEAGSPLCTLAVDSGCGLCVEPGDDVMEVVFSGVAQWRARGEHPLAPPSVVEASAVVVRALENIAADQARVVA